MRGAQKIAYSLDGLIRSRTKGDGGDTYARKCIGEIAEGIEELTALQVTTTPERTLDSTPTSNDVLAVRHLLVRQAHAHLQAGCSDTQIGIDFAAGAVLLGSHLGDICAALRLLEGPVRQAVSRLIQEPS